MNSRRQKRTGDPVLTTAGTSIAVAAGGDDVANNPDRWLKLSDAFNTWIFLTQFEREVGVGGFEDDFNGGGGGAATARQQFERQLLERLAAQEERARQREAKRQEQERLRVAAREQRERERLAAAKSGKLLLRKRRPQRGRNRARSVLCLQLRPTIRRTIL